MTESQMTDITANGNGAPSSPGFEAPYLLLPICDAACQEDQAVCQVQGQGADKQASLLSGPRVLIKDHTRHIHFPIYSFHTQRGAVPIVETRFCVYSCLREPCLLLPPIICLSTKTSILDHLIPSYNLNPK